VADGEREWTVMKWYMIDETNQEESEQLTCLNFKPENFYRLWSMFSSQIDISESRNGCQRKLQLWRGLRCVYDAFIRCSASSCSTSNTCIISKCA